jgi:hypothetical protein
VQFHAKYIHCIIKFYTTMWMEADLQIVLALTVGCAAFEQELMADFLVHVGWSVEGQ